MSKLPLVLIVSILQAQFADATSILSISSQIDRKIAVCEAKGELTGRQVISFKERKQFILTYTSEPGRKQIDLEKLSRQIDERRRPAFVAQRSLKWW